MNALLRELVGVRRRIDNKHYLLRFDEEKRDQLAARIRESLGRCEPRTRFIDFDARRDPKTDCWCVMCQKDLTPDRQCSEVRLIHIDAAPHAIHVEDAVFVDLGVLTLPARSTDYGTAFIGSDCARKLGKGWWRPVPKSNQTK